MPAGHGQHVGVAAQVRADHHVAALGGGEPAVEEDPLQARVAPLADHVPQKDAGRRATTAEAVLNTKRYVRPRTRTLSGTRRLSRGWIPNDVGAKPMRWSTRLGMTELKNVSSTCCADAVAGTSSKAPTTRTK